MIEDIPAVKIDELSYKYLSSNQLDQGNAVLKQVLENISFKVKEGERISIIGPNGAGNPDEFDDYLYLML